MNFKEDNDDFWNESSSTYNFNFFDEDATCSFLTDQSLFKAEDKSTNTCPSINSVISGKNLDLILNEVNATTIPQSVAPPEESIGKMFNGERIVLVGIYRSLDHKLLLLDAAIEIGDGDVILKVILFMKQTLKFNVFLNNLCTRKSAVGHYINYLIEQNDHEEIANLYMASGNVYGLKDLYHLHCKNSTSLQSLQKKLHQFSVEYAQNLYFSDDRAEVLETISFINNLVKYSPDRHSVIGLLMEVCTTDWAKGNDETILEMKRQFKPDEFQFDWLIMNMLCKGEKWDKLIATFLKNVWVLKKRSLKTVIRPDLLVMGIARHNPPKDVLKQFLLCVSDTETALNVAERTGVHSYVVDHYVNQKDKLALLKYMDKAQNDEETLKAIQSALNNTSIRWKNH